MDGMTKAEVKDAGVSIPAGPAFARAGVAAGSETALFGRSAIAGPPRASTPA
jgi:hypothetical protein